ncbi:hypothetical protein ACGFYV_21250 [Streptomyces sp. NPDC048297]|uniref:hypothetical protein n=1 Tax=Streptomyces sp. NPDC048297 TaxID=3365531 RepID=UPI00371003BB
MTPPMRYAVAAVPAVAFFATPFLPFVNTTRLWLGMPAAVVWGVLWTIGTTAALGLIDCFGTHQDEGDAA